MGTPTTTSPPHRERYARGEGDRLRVDLLDAAAELMAEHGSIEGISLRAVARRAGVSPTAVYRHFDDHVDLLRDSVTHCWTNFRDALASSVDPALDPFENFERMGRAYIAFALDHPGQYRVMFSNRVDVGGGPEQMGDSVGESAFQMLVDHVETMLGVLHDDRDPFFVAVQVHTWIHGIVDLISCHPGVDWPSIDDLLHGLDVALGLVPPG